MSKDIFVFGSNRAGRHGKGAAFVARIQHGAIYGQGEGPQGRSYAIPTKCEKLKVLPLSSVRKSVEAFIRYAHDHPELTFHVTAIGTGLAGYTHDDIGPMFSNVPNNCIMPLKWKPYIYNDEIKYWIS